MGKASKSSSGGGMRQRKKKKNQSSTDDTNNQQANNNNNNKRRTKTSKVDREVEEEEEIQEEEPAWHIIRRHPAFLIVVFLGIPYLLKLTATWLILQHPSYLKWFNPNIRPSISMEETRQLLIVGSMSSATTQTSKDFQSILQIELGHEDTDTSWQFCRDGTISWFHSIRYMRLKSKESQINELCDISWEFYSRDKMNFFQPWSNYGWGPTLFGPMEYDRYHISPKFKSSYVKSCVKTLSSEFGCGLLSNKEGSQSCKTPFERTLIQTRQPWKIVTSLVSKYCYVADKKEFKLPPKSFLKFMKALFPNDDDDVWSMQPLDSNENLRVCVNQMGTYVYRLYTELLDNTNQKSSKQQQIEIYPIETTTICDVVKMGGFFDEATIVYKPNYDSVKEFCKTNSTQLFGQTVNQFNRGRLDLSQIVTEADQKLQTNLLNLHKRMGYTNHPMM